MTTTSKSTKNSTVGNLPDGRLVLTVAEAAEMLNMKTSTLQDQVEEGQMPHLRVSARGIRIVWPDHFAIYLERCQQNVA